MGHSPQNCVVFPVIVASLNKDALIVSCCRVIDLSDPEIVSWTTRVTPPVLLARRVQTERKRWMGVGVGRKQNACFRCSEHIMVSPQCPLQSRGPPMSHSAFKGSSCASPSDRSGGRQDFSFLPPRTLSTKMKLNLGKSGKGEKGLKKEGSNVW